MFLFYTKLKFIAINQCKSTQICQILQLNHFALIGYLKTHKTSNKIIPHQLSIAPSIPTRTDGLSIILTIFSGRPAAPVNLEVIDITEDSVTISWLSPHSSGSSRIFRYVVEVCDVSRSDGWVKVKEVDSSARLVACVENLKESKPYLFRVSAENQYGPGAATETTDPIVPRSQLGT